MKHVEAYIDIHSRILPKMDDMVENFETSMKMLRTACADGTEKISINPAAASLAWFWTRWIWQEKAAMGIMESIMEKFF